MDIQKFRELSNEIRAIKSALGRLEKVIADEETEFSEQEVQK